MASGGCVAGGCGVSRSGRTTGGSGVARVRSVPHVRRVAGGCVVAHGRSVTRGGMPGRSVTRRHCVTRRRVVLLGFRGRAMRWRFRGALFFLPPCKSRHRHQ